MDWQNFDLKKSVNLPKTDFPMKANLAQAEPKLLARWEAEKLYHQIREARAGRPRYVLHDGPPYANGNIHLGHAFNKLLKDFIIKSKTMAGYDSPYVPGWDCHGLPIEIKVDNELGSKKAHMSASQVRAECRKYAQKYVNLQRQDFQRLGIFGRWEDPYLTMSPEFESTTARAFVEFLEKGFIYKGLKPVNWCFNDRTALAEAEVEYENHVSPSVYVRFELKSDASKLDPALAGKRVYGLIWTTTPWTLPANLAISFHPKFEYLAVEVGDAVYIVAGGLLEDTASKLGWGEAPIIARFDGDKLEGALFAHPFLERDSIGLIGDHVTLEQGTGAVHTAPGHGQEDYVICQRYGIPTYCPVDANGRFFHAEGANGTLPEEIIGKNVWQANPIVTEILRSKGALLAELKIEHSYPHCWRCHKPTIFRATEQWFIGMEMNNLRQNALEAIKGVKWMPAWGEERISNMIASRPDWCISRQRVWGVPIIVFYCEGCSEPLTDPKLLYPIADRFATESSDAWYQHSAEELLGPGVSCTRCGGGAFRKESDILDVWFDSGTSNLAVLTAKNDLPWPSDVYLEGGDQYRGWFHSSLLIGVGLRGGAPYRTCLTNGWTLDGEGRAMSKSIGNTIEPEKIVNQFGAEILRLWIASVEYNDDVRLSDTILARVSESYRKMRNTFKYGLGNISDFDPVKDAVAADKMETIDHWVLVRAESLVQRCLAWYEEFAFHKVYHAFSEFCTVDLSAVYFDILKDRLYTSATNSAARRSGQTALYRLMYAMVRLMEPILTFTSEEIWTQLRKPEGAPGSVHLALFPQAAELTQGLNEEHRQQAAAWEGLLPVRESVLKSLENARKEKLIGAPLEAKVHLQASEEDYPRLEKYKGQLPGMFIVSEVTIENHGNSEIAVRVEKADGLKCERCWKYKTDVGSDADLPTVCASCAAAVREMFGS